MSSQVVRKGSNMIAKDNAYFYEKTYNIGTADCMKHGIQN
jgi:hypothetical protein